MSGELPNTSLMAQQSGGAAGELVKGGRVAPGTPVKLDGFEIYPGKPLPQYDVGPVKAYQALSKERGSGDHFALVCERHLMQRLDDIPAYKSITNNCAVPLAGARAVFWPLVQQERFVLVYQNTLGNRLLQPGQPQALGWRQEEVLASLVLPMVGLLQDFKDRDFVHGCINPANMYDGGQPGRPQKVILGECLSVPASSAQPVLYETLERSMAHPVGRGIGTSADDIYAFGASIAVIMRSFDPLEGLTDEEIIRAKIEHGSYAAITGKDRFKGSILELLRGLLIDDPAERWTLEEIKSWLDGRRLSPKQSSKQKKAPRPIIFAGQKFFHTAALAMELDNNIEETRKIVEHQDLDQWLSRALEDEEIQERVSKAVKAAQERGVGPGYEERLSANLSMALDPNAPIRFKGLKLMGEGVGSALAAAMAFKQDIQGYAEMFAQGIPLNWITQLMNPRMDVGALISRFDTCRNFIRQGKIGYGIERCLYLLCPEAHCMSEKLNAYFVRTPEEMLRAFEDMCEKGKVPALFIDRHSAAFLAAKDPKVIEAHLFELNGPEDYKKIFGNIKTLAAIQKRTNVGNLRAIARAFLEVLPLVYERYHDRQIREKIQKTISRHADEGDLVKMAAVLDNVEVVARDFQGFKLAMNEYADLNREYAMLEKQLNDKTTFGKTMGKEVAAVMSSLIASVLILVTVFMFIANKSIF